LVIGTSRIKQLGCDIQGDVFLKNLKLSNYRNFSSVDLKLSNSTLFVGKNAQGKSNVLDAVYFLATTKSPKAEKDSQLIKEDQTVCRVEGVIEKEGEGENNLEIVMQDNSEGFTKRTRVNGVSRRVVDYLGNLVVIQFVPEDLNLVIGSPSLRRWHLDITLAQIDRDYKRAISEYSEVITKRNRVLKKIREGLSRIDELSFWTDRLLVNGLVISDKRNQFFKFLSASEKILGQNYEYVYLPNVLTKDRLDEYLDREIASASSLIGPHRDDFMFTLNGRNLAYFGSRGEQRTAVLDLKLLELEYVTRVFNSKPILLLDDIFSELDDEHRDHVISVIKNQQTILTAVENEIIPKDFLDMTQVIKVKGGVLIDS
jgi:DNA replication and repair protein RecF